MQSFVEQRQSLYAVAGLDVNVFLKMCHSKAEVTLLRDINCPGGVDCFVSETHNYEAFF